MERVVSQVAVAERGDSNHDEAILDLALRFMNELAEAERLEAFLDAYQRDESQTFLTADREGRRVRFSVTHGTFVDAQTGTIYQLRTDESGYHKEVYKCETKSFHGVLATPARVFDARSSEDLKTIGADYYAGDNQRDNLRPLLESPLGYIPEHATELQPNRNSLRILKHDDGSIEGWVNDGVTEQEHRVYALQDIINKIEDITSAHADFERPPAETELAGQVGHKALILVEAA